MVTPDSCWPVDTFIGELDLECHLKSAFPGLEADAVSAGLSDVLGGVWSGSRKVRPVRKAEPVSGRGGSGREPEFGEEGVLVSVCAHLTVKGTPERKGGSSLCLPFGLYLRKRFI